MTTYSPGRHFSQIIEPLSSTDCPQELLIYFGAYVQDSLSIMKSIKENLYKLINIQITIPPKPKINYKSMTFKEVIEGLKLTYQELHRIQSIVKGHAGGSSKTQSIQLPSSISNSAKALYQQNNNKNIYGFEASVPRYQYVEQEDIYERQLSEQTEEQIQQENQKLKARIQYLRNYLPIMNTRKDKDEMDKNSEINLRNHQDPDQEQCLTLVQLIREEYHRQKTLMVPSRRPSQQIQNI